MTKNYFTCHEITEQLPKIRIVGGVLKSQSTAVLQIDLEFIRVASTKGFDGHLLGEMKIKTRLQFWIP